MSCFFISGIVIINIKIFRDYAYKTTNKALDRLSARIKLGLS